MIIEQIREMRRIRAGFGILLQRRVDRGNLTEYENSADFLREYRKLSQTIFKQIECLNPGAEITEDDDQQGSEEG